MKFGLESEKFIFNLDNRAPSRGVYRFLDALSDLNPDQSLNQQVTNEFVLNMVELGTTPSHSPMEVMKDYFFQYLMIQSVALRERVALVPMSSLPMNYLPHMTPKRAYYVQNSILAGKKQEGWMMKARSPLRAAGNCAGIHVHAEISTPPEFLYSNNELRDKFNMGLMLSPMIAFASSPYFFGESKAHSMRGLRYYNGVYSKFPLNGGLPSVMNSSVEVLDYVKESINHWIDQGIRLGFKKDELLKLTEKKSANWNPVRWNRQWNTIEIRCLESDSIELDVAKFIWVTGAFKRLDPKREGLSCEIIKTKSQLDKHMIRDCLKVSGKKVSILPARALEELFQRAIIHGTEDKYVEEYLNQLAVFISKDLNQEYRWIFNILRKVLDSHNTTSARILARTKKRKKITNAIAVDMVLESIESQNKIIKVLPKYIPEVFQLLNTVTKEL